MRDRGRDGADRRRGNAATAADETGARRHPRRDRLRVDVRGSAPGAGRRIPALAAVRVGDHREARDLRGQPHGGEGAVRVGAVHAHGSDAGLEELVVQEGPDDPVEGFALGRVAPVPALERNPALGSVELAQNVEDCWRK